MIRAGVHRERARRRRAAAAPTALSSPSAVSAMERLMAANSAELVRADTKAAVFLAFTGAVLAAFVPSDGGGGDPVGRLLRWSAVAGALLAVACFAAALVPRRRKGRRGGTAGPGYFEHVARGAGPDRLRRAFERAGRDPAGPLLAALAGTSAIIRVKYRWIEAGTVLLLLALPQFALTLRPL
ncbi:Pycsar system effector family protein [Kitasatospora sp. NPDC086791]|uniref:Pycsar system effector family protein n=1 Tax=Kitasatospora sp. NPDC086791 TaxID=3155178 RepID=UPI003444B4C7